VFSTDSDSDHGCIHDEEDTNDVHAHVPYANWNGNRVHGAYPVGVDGMMEFHDDDDHCDADANWEGNGSVQDCDHDEDDIQVHVHREDVYVHEGAYLQVKAHGSWDAHADVTVEVHAMEVHAMEVHDDHCDDDGNGEEEGVVVPHAQVRAQVHDDTDVEEVLHAHDFHGLNQAHDYKDEEEVNSSQGHELEQVLYTGELQWVLE